MDGKKYEVLVNDCVVAERMALDTATILLKALFAEYHNEYQIVVSIKEMERCEGVCEGVCAND